VEVGVAVHVNQAAALNPLEHKWVEADLHDLAEAGAFTFELPLGSIESARYAQVVACGAPGAHSRATSRCSANGKTTHRARWSGPTCWSAGGSRQRSSK